MGQPVRSVADYLSALLQEQIDAWRDELVKTTSAQVKADHDSGSNRDAEYRTNSGSGGDHRSENNDVAGVPPLDGPDNK
jgi:hypothetical protein